MQPCVVDTVVVNRNFGKVQCLCPSGLHLIEHAFMKLLHFQGASGLYVGHDPSSIAGITSDISIHRKMGRPPPATTGNYSTTKNRHRWGNVQEYSGDANEIVLSGNAVSVHDTV